MCSRPAGPRPPRWELPEVFRLYGREYRRTHRPPPSHLEVMRAVEVCRTAELGGHIERCDACGFERPAYNSCRNRHCPKCQSLAKARWLAARRAELLPVGYFHAVFTLPHELNRPALANERTVFDILFRSAAATRGTGSKASSASPRSCTPGTRGSATTCTCTASSREERSPRSAGAGPTRAADSSFPSGRCRRYSGASFSTTCSGPTPHDARASASTTPGPSPGHTRVPNATPFGDIPQNEFEECCPRGAVRLRRHRRCSFGERRRRGRWPLVPLVPYNRPSACWRLRAVLLTIPVAPQKTVERKLFSGVSRMSPMRPAQSRDQAGQAEGVA